MAVPGRPPGAPGGPVWSAIRATRRAGDPEAPHAWTVRRPRVVAGKESSLPTDNPGQSALRWTPTNSPSGRTVTQLSLNAPIRSRGQTRGRFFFFPFSWLYQVLKDNIYTVVESAIAKQHWEQDACFRFAVRNSRCTLGGVPGAGERSQVGPCGAVHGL